MPVLKLTVAGVDDKVMVGVEEPSRAVEQTDFISVGRVVVEVAGYRQTVDLESGRLRGDQVGHAVGVEVEQPAEGARMLP